MKIDEFKEWLEGKKFDEVNDVIDQLKRGNELYNLSKDSDFDFFKDTDRFLEVIYDNQLSDIIAKNLEEITGENHKSLKAAFKLDMDIINSSALYFDFLSEIKNNLNDKKINLENYLYDTNRLKGGYNKIYYGAPGTGKSYKVNKMNKNKNIERITFHPEYTYFDFVGSLKPVQNKESDIIKYEFISGPFTDVLINALLNPKQEYNLVIEEINRANTAGVFGDLFQLLDRNDDGTSEYSVKNKEITDYLYLNYNIKMDYIFIPSNLNIIATMNSADQGVYVMDSAFKRRWQFEYLPIDFETSDLQNVWIAGFDMLWKDFGKVLNNHLSSHGVEEDKLIGQRFISKRELSDKDLVASKLLIYLWDDVLRYERYKVFPINDINTFEELRSRYFNNGIDIFNEELKEKFEIVFSKYEEKKDSVSDE